MSTLIRRAVLKFCEFARGLIEATFQPYDPQIVQQSLPVERCVELLATLKPGFIHHPKIEGTAPGNTCGARVRSGEDLF